MRAQPRLAVFAGDAAGDRLARSGLIPSNRRLRGLVGIVAVLSPFSVVLAAGPSPMPSIVRYPSGQLGGVDALMRYDAARPDRTETRYLFLSDGEAATAPPEEVQVLGRTGEQTHLSDQDGADCTLSHVEVLPGRTPLVVSAVRIPPNDLRSLNQSQAAAMEIQVYRPEAGQDAGESRIVLRAAAPPVRTVPLCGADKVRAAMLRVATAAGRK